MFENQIESNRSNNIIYNKCIENKKKTRKILKKFVANKQRHIGLYIKQIQKRKWNSTNKEKPRNIDIAKNTTLISCQIYSLII